MRTAFRSEAVSKLQPAPHEHASPHGSAAATTMSAPQAKRLKTALLAADVVSAADAVKKLAGTGVTREQLSACLRAAALTLDTGAPRCEGVRAVGQAGPLQRL